MTSFCPLNQPQCKRTIMSKGVPFEKKQCPLNVKTTCPFAPPTCPIVGQDDVCFLAKMKDVADSGGCQGPCGFRAAEKGKENTPAKRLRVPERDFPPCNRCGRQGGKVMANKQTENLLMAPAPKKKKKKKVTEKLYTAPSATVHSKEDKVEELQNRDYLTVPPCTTSSRRPLPCSSCIVEILKAPQPLQRTGDSKVYKRPEQYKMCPYLRVVDMCAPGCLCSEVPPVDTGPSCPFLPLKCPCCSEPTCVLNRFANCPLIQQPPKPTPMQGGTCDCCCPPIHNPCTPFTTPFKTFLPVSGLVPRNADGKPITLVPGYQAAKPPLPPCKCPEGTCPAEMRREMKKVGLDPYCKCCCQGKCGCSEEEITIVEEPPLPKPETPQAKPESAKTIKLEEPKSHEKIPTKVAKPSQPLVKEEPAKPKENKEEKEDLVLTKTGDGYKIFMKGGQKFLINYDEKNCKDMGCGCTQNIGQTGCGCDKWARNKECTCQFGGPKRKKKKKKKTQNEGSTMVTKESSGASGKPILVSSSVPTLPNAGSKETTPTFDLTKTGSKARLVVETDKSAEPSTEEIESYTNTVRKRRKKPTCQVCTEEEHCGQEGFRLKMMQKSAPEKTEAPSLVHKNTGGAFLHRMGTGDLLSWPSVYSLQTYRDKKDMRRPQYINPKAGLSYPLIENREQPQKKEICPYIQNPNILRDFGNVIVNEALIDTSQSKVLSFLKEFDRKLEGPGYGWIRRELNKEEPTCYCSQGDKCTCKKRIGFEPKKVEKKRKNSCEVDWGAWDNLKIESFPIEEKVGVTFHVPTCPSKRPLVQPVSNVPDQKVCPFAPACCPLGPICPFPVTAKYDPNGPEISSTAKCVLSPSTQWCPFSCSATEGCPLDTIKPPSTTTTTVKDCPLSECSTSPCGRSSPDCPLLSCRLGSLMKWVFKGDDVCPFCGGADCPLITPDGMTDFGLPENLCTTGLPDCALKNAKCPGFPCSPCFGSGSPHDTAEPSCPVGMMMEASAKRTCPVVLMSGNRKLEQSCPVAKRMNCDSFKGELIPSPLGSPESSCPVGVMVEAAAKNTCPMLLMSKNPKLEQSCPVSVPLKYGGFQEATIADQAQIPPRDTATNVKSCCRTPCCSLQPKMAINVQIPLSRSVYKDSDSPPPNCPFLPQPPCLLASPKCPYSPPEPRCPLIRKTSCPLLTKSKTGEPSKLECPVENPPCDMFPEGRCPMSDLNLCDCDYPVSPCMEPILNEEGEGEPLKQYCIRLDCCMGLPLPPIKPAEGGRFETGTWYKFRDRKPKEITTKHFIQILNFPPTPEFFKGRTVPEHPDWYIVKGGEAYMQCKKVKELIKRRGPSQDIGVQYDPKDNPIDLETRIVMENKAAHQENKFGTLHFRERNWKFE